MKIQLFLTLLSVCVLTTYSCTQFEDIGSDLVDGDQLKITTDTDLDYELQTFERDSMLAYVREGLDADFVPTNHIIGQINDPTFGYTRYDLTAQVQFDQSGIDFSGSTFDSAFLLLSYDTTFAPYGETDPVQTVDIFELTSRELPNRIYVTDKYETKVNPIGSHTYTSDYKNQNRGDSLSAPSHIRIPLTQEFGQRILSLDTSITSSVLDFLDEFPGFVISPRKGSFSGAYRFYAYATSTAQGQTGNSAITPYSGIRIYYTQGGESKEAYMRMSSGLHHFTTVEHDYSGSVLGNVLQDQTAQPEYLFIQPTGVGIRVDFKDLSNYQGKVINDVSLTWSVAGYPEDDTTIYKPTAAIFALENELLAERVPITDILFYQSGGAYQQYFGGFIQDNSSGVGSRYVYKFNITNEFQRIVDGETDPSIYLVPTPQDVSRIARSVIYGSGIEDAAVKPKIKITYSSTNN